MTVWLHATLACVWGMGAALVAWRHPRRVARALDGFTREVAAIRDLEATPRVAAANELLTDLEHDLVVLREIPPRAARIGVVGVAAWLVLGALTAPGWPLAVGALGLVLALGGALVAARRGEQLAAQARKEADRRLEVELGSAYDDEVAMPERRRLRFRRGPAGRAEQGFDPRR